MVLSFIGMLSVGTNQASAAYDSGWGYFHSEDGKHEGFVSTNSTERDVLIVARGLWKASYAGSGYQPAYASNIKARLCNVSTGACTPYKIFNDNGVANSGYVLFTGMYVGTYKVDISDYWTGGYVFGERRIYGLKW